MYPTNLHEALRRGTLSNKKTYVPISSSTPLNPSFSFDLKEYARMRGSEKTMRSEKKPKKRPRKKEISQEDKKPVVESEETSGDGMFWTSPVEFKETKKVKTQNKDEESIPQKDN